jgi:hypothetical protein
MHQRVEWPQARLELQGHIFSSPEMPRTHLGPLETGAARIHHELCVVAREDRQANNPGRVAQSHALDRPSNMQRQYFRNEAIRSTARGKMWGTRSGAFCIEN